MIYIMQSIRQNKLSVSLRCQASQPQALQHDTLKGPEAPDPARKP